MRSLTDPPPDPHCAKCGGEHICPIVSLKSEGRYCREHDCFHPLDNGVLWVEKRSIFSFRQYLLCFEGVVLDVTAQLNCMGLPHSISSFEANACKPLHMTQEKKPEAQNKYKGKAKKGKRS